MSQSRRSKRSQAPKLLRHRNLLTLEAVLLVAVLQELIQNQIEAALIPNVLKALYTVINNAGMFGGLLLFIVSLTKGSLAKTHDVIQALPIPTPLVLVHTTIWLSLIVLHAWVWNFWPIWPVSTTTHH